MPPEGTPLSRAELQERLRRAHKVAKKRRHRWRRRGLYALSFILLVGVLGSGGIYLYVNYRYDQIKKVHLRHLVKAAPPGQPFDMLLVGSDSRAFVGNSSALANDFGNPAVQSGQRSDVTMVARFVPATKTVTVLSIPRDLWVDIPGHVSGISGMNRINAAFNNGPDLLVQTIEQVLGIPINHYASVEFLGFVGMVQALGGVDMDFPTPVRDSLSGLNVNTTGCQSVDGTTALELVRSRHLYYKNANGYWAYDGLSDFSRIQRQDAFFRAVLAKVNMSDTNPLAINGFISAAVGNLTISTTLTQSDMLHIAEEFKGLPSSHLVTETLPTTSFVTDGGADVLLEAQPYANQMISAFNALGQPKVAPSPAGTPTTAPPLAPAAVSVTVLNASGAGELATDTASALRQDGFAITGINNAPKVIAAGDPSEIYYGPDGLAAAHTLGDSLTGAVTDVADPSLTGNALTLWVANAELSVTATTTTTTTTPGSTATSTTLPGDIYANKQQEPWNPYPCTLGAPTTTTTAAARVAAKSAKSAKAAKATKAKAATTGSG